MQAIDLVRVAYDLFKNENSDLQEGFGV